MHFQLAAVARAGIKRPYRETSAEAPLSLEVEFRRERDRRDIFRPRRGLGQRLVKQTL
jgi:hypothetical protein